jgi:hypothetical protein
MEFWRFEMQEEIEKRFWEKVKISTINFYNNEPCWEWLACVDKNGYGIFRLNGKNEKSHRFSFILKNGEIKNNLFVCHACDNPKCVNPNHLWLGTNQDNVDDMMKKGRQLKGDDHWSRKKPDKLARGDRSASIKYPGIRKGENNGCAKLNWESAKNIRKLYFEDDYLLRELAKMYSVTTTTIWRVVINKTWQV